MVVWASLPASSERAADPVTEVVWETSARCYHGGGPCCQALLVPEVLVAADTWPLVRLVLKEGQGAWASGAYPGASEAFRLAWASLAFLGAFPFLEDPYLAIQEILAYLETKAFPWAFPSLACQPSS